MQNIQPMDNEFNGYLYSLRNFCNIHSLEEFSYHYSCDFSRVHKLYKSNLHGLNYIDNILYSNNFEEDFLELIKRNNYFSRKKDKTNNNILMSQLNKAYELFCDKGLVQIKDILKKQSVKHALSKVLLLALEIEEMSILAKNADNIESSKYKYCIKEELIEELMIYCDIMNINYGYKESDIPTMRSIVLFDLPCGQVSWHSNIMFNKNRIYNGEWDEKEHSTLKKIEIFIKSNFVLDNKI